MHKVKSRCPHVSNENITFTPGSNIWIDIPTRDAVPVEGRNQPMERRVMILNAITPETERTCHYFWANARDFDLESQERSDFFLKTVTFAFNEDKDILEAQQRNIEAGLVVVSTALACKVRDQFMSLITAQAVSRIE